MPGHIKALIVILLLTIVTFALLKRPACVLGNCLDFLRRRNLWFALTLVAFVGGNYWLYAMVAGLLLAYAAKRDSSRVGLFFSMMMVLPPGDVPIPGFGAINYLFSLNHVRILELVILLPAFLKLSLDEDKLRFGRLATDKFLAAYLLLALLLSLRVASATDFMRQGLYLWLDIFLPYYVISRSLKSLQDFREAMLAFVIALLVVSPIVTFEASWGWHLYLGVSGVLGLPLTPIIERSGVVRAIGPLQNAIAVGYAMTVGLGFYLFLKRGLASHKNLGRLGMLLLIAGLAAPLSRGPWVGAVVLIGVYFLTGPQAIKRLVMAAATGALLLAVLSTLPVGRQIVDLLPFIGTVETGNIDYRSQVLENGKIVIMRNPWFGSTDFINTPEMQALKQGQGIIDIVNSYVLFALQFGLVGLGLFIPIFLSSAWAVHSALRGQTDKDSDIFVLGRVLLACLAAVMTIIFTVSPISLIPIIYWSLAAMGVAYGQLVSRQGQEARAA